MREATRQQYLKTMGIQMWMPRRSLPNAPESPLLAAVENSITESLEQKADVGTEPPSQAGHEHSGRLSAEQLLAGSHPPPHYSERSRQSGHPLSDSTPPHSESPTAEPIPNIPTADTAQSLAPTSQTSTPLDLSPPRFELHFIRVGNRGVWVCDDVGQLALLESFARRVAMGMSMPFDPTLRIPSFRWPFIEQGKEDQSAAVARQALAAQWQFLRSQGVSYVVGFGPNTKDWLVQIEVKGYLTEQPLDAWIQQPGSKRALWLRLLDLQQREYQEL